MKINSLNCPTCGSPLDANTRSNRPFSCPACGSAVVLTDWTESGELVCTRCGTVNGSTNKCCDKCSTALQAGCPFCYAQNDVSAINCKKCGVNLQRAWQRQDAWFTQREQKHQ